MESFEKLQRRNSKPFRVASVFPGRVRIQWTGSLTGQMSRNRLENLAATLSTMAGVSGAWIVPDARSIVIRYAANERALADVLTDIASATAALAGETGLLGRQNTRDANSHKGASSSLVSLSAVPEYIGEDFTTPPRGAALIHPSAHASPTNTTKRAKSLLLSMAAVAAAATEAVPAALVGVLLALAAFPLARRAVRAVRHRRLSMDQLDFANLLLLALVGDLVTAGQISLIINLSDLWGSKRLRHIRHRLYELLLLESIGRDTDSQQVVKMIENAFIANARIEHEISKEGDHLVIPLLGAAGAAFVLTGDPLRMVSVLKFSDLASDVRIAAPTTVLSAMTVEARHGIVFRSARAMEKLAGMDAIALDHRVETLLNVAGTGTESEHFTAAIEALLDRGVKRIVLGAGRASRAARSVVRKRGLANVIVEVTANRFDAAVQQLRDKGYQLAILGDGVDGSPVFMNADVGVVISHRAVTAEQKADLFLLDGDLRSLSRAIDCACEVMAILNQNKRLVVAPTAVGLTASILGLTTPLMGTLLNHGMAAVAGLNALRPLLHQAQPHPHAPAPARNRSAVDK